MSNDVVTVGCKTTTGGIVISGNGGVIINGQQVALVGDTATCPCGSKSCKGQGPIVPQSSRAANLSGVDLARVGDFVDTGCGNCFIDASPHNVSLSTSMATPLNMGGGVNIGNGVNINLGGISATSNQINLSSKSNSYLSEKELITTSDHISEVKNFSDLLTPLESIKNSLKKKIKDGVYVWVETVGVGHSFVSVIENGEPTLYSYGRYGNDGVNNGVLLIYKGSAAFSYMRDQLYSKEATVFYASNANSRVVNDYYVSMYSKGSQILNTKVSNQQVATRLKKFGRVIDQYDLTSNNCTSHAVESLLLSGSDVDKDIKIPLSFESFLRNSNIFENVTSIFFFYYSYLYENQAKQGNIEDIIMGSGVKASGDEIIKLSQWIK